jgi:hypothetical protein
MLQDDSTMPHNWPSNTPLTASLTAASTLKNILSRVKIILLSIFLPNKCLLVYIHEIGKDRCPFLLKSTDILILKEYFKFYILRDLYSIDFGGDLMGRLLSVHVSHVMTTKPCI